jgi:hypothetical protein
VGSQRQGWIVPLARLSGNVTPHNSNRVRTKSCRVLQPGPAKRKQCTRQNQILPPLKKKKNWALILT